jgi:hypothetical protein
VVAFRMLATLAMRMDVINSTVASALVAAALGARPVEVRRFGTGLHHYVFEAAFEDRAPVVVRIASKESRSAMVGAFELSRRLRPLGVRLPRIIAEGLSHRLPHLVLERLPGTDLGNVVRTLSDSRLEAIAMEVARAQRITRNTASVGGTDMPSTRPTRLASGGRKFCKTTSRGRANGSRRSAPLISARSMPSPR